MDKEQLKKEPEDWEFRSAIAKADKIQFVKISIHY